MKLYWEKQLAHVTYVRSSVGTVLSMMLIVDDDRLYHWYAGYGTVQYRHFIKGDQKSTFEPRSTKSKEEVDKVFWICKLQLFAPPYIFAFGY